MLPDTTNMSGRGEESKSDGKLSAESAQCYPRRQLASPLRLLLRLAVVLAFGFNIAGPGDLYVAGKTLRNYLRDIERLSSTEAGSDIAIYICSGILLATGFYLLLHRMTSTVNGIKSPIQKSKPLRYASIALCGLWVECDSAKETASSVVRYASGEGMTLPGVLFAVCGRSATAFQMGLLWYKLVSTAFEPSRKQVVSRHMYKDAYQSEMQSV